MSLDDKINVAAQLVDSQFLPGSSVQFAWDSVSLSSILACPRRYQYQIVLGLTPRNPSYAIALVFGILFHRGVEHYHRARATGADHSQAMFIAARKLINDPATATLPIDEEIAEKKAAFDPDEDDGIDLRNSKIRTRYYLLRAVIWYLEHYEDDPCKTIILASGAPAVELSFRIPLEHITVAGHPVLLCGHIDRGVEFQGNLYAADYKTTKSLTSQFFKMFDISHQMSGYTVAGSVIFPEPAKGCLIDGVALQVGQVKFNRSFTDRTRGQIDEYYRTVQSAVDTAVKCADTDNYPQNPTSCYFCEFKDLCAQPPEFRERYIKAHYLSRPGWNPLENR